MRARILSCLAVAGAAAGCESVTGVDFGAVHPRDQSETALGGDDDGGGVTFDSGDQPEGGPVGSSVPCPSGQKTCHGACVSIDDPTYGCTPTSCAACSVPYATATGCRAGACIETKCAAGRADCDGNASNGCESDLSDVAHCGSCTTACSPTEVCAPAGCTSTCPVGLVKCGTSCVDVNSNPSHCSNCTTSCPALANADPACSNGSCTIACHSGFADCDGNPRNGCEALTVYYLDADKDGYGTSATTTQACTLPSGYSAAGGDCQDNNASVNPGDTNYYGTPYTTPSGGSSYDYNCNGVEERATETLFQGCGGSCSGGGGYLSTACGSTTIGYCVPYPGCSVHTTTSGSPYPCR
jgi:hypothetical protein